MKKKLSILYSGITIRPQTKERAPYGTEYHTWMYIKRNGTNIVESNAKNVRTSGGFIHKI
jgi:hypothetical protein